MHDTGVRFRDAVPDDLPAIVELLADDELGKLREDPSNVRLAAYREAFEEIVGDPNHTILVGESGSDVSAVLQLSYIPHLTYEGGWRAQIEGVRVARALRGSGVGRALVELAIERARARGCHLVQLTTDRRRPEALRFYERLGFLATHEGLKLHLEGPGT